MVRLSLCMIVKNEELFLEQCLLAAKDFTDEIIVVDTGSTDATKAIAKRFTDKVFDFQWCDNFSAARNESLKQATGDWILVLDADEMILPEDFEKIRHELLSCSDDVKGFVLPIRTFTYSFQERGFMPLASDETIHNYFTSVFPARHYPVGYTLTSLTRLFRNTHQFFYQNPIHELIEPSLRGFHVKKLAILIQHYECFKQGNQQKQKQKLYLELQQKKIAQNPQDAKAWYELAVAILSEKQGGKEEKEEEREKEKQEKIKKEKSKKEKERYENARPVLERAWSLDASFLPAVLDLLYVYAKLGEEEKISAVLKKTPSLTHHPETLFSLAILFYDKKNYKKAYTALRTLLAAHPEHFPAKRLVGTLLFRCKHFRAAKPYLEKVLSCAPNDVKILSQRAAIACTEKEYDTAETLLQKVVTLDPSRADAHYNLGVLAERRGNRETAKERYATFLALRPERQDVRERIERL